MAKKIVSQKEAYEAINSIKYLHSRNIQQSQLELPIRQVIELEYMPPCECINCKQRFRCLVDDTASKTKLPGSCWGFTPNYDLVKILEPLVKTFGEPHIESGKGRGEQGYVSSQNIHWGHYLVWELREEERNIDFRITFMTK